MADKELLELAAKAAGLRFEFERRLVAIGDFAVFPVVEGMDWNPLTDDGDALRLAVKLKLDVTHYEAEVSAWKYREGHANVNYNADPYAATRRAIVRAAAEIGRSMK